MATSIPSCAHAWARVCTGPASTTFAGAPMVRFAKGYYRDVDGKSAKTDNASAPRPVKTASVDAMWPTEPPEDSRVVCRAPVTRLGPFADDKHRVPSVLRFPFGDFGDFAYELVSYTGVPVVLVESFFDRAHCLAIPFVTVF